MGSYSRRPVQPFVVMAKPVGSRCNLACEYCYYSRSFGSDRTEGSDNSGGSRDLRRMSDELLDLFIRQYIEASNGPEVHIVWHGGEPTLAGLDFFRRAVELQKRYLPQGWSCRNNLQTNGVLLNDEWCSFIAEARFDVGLSIDGVESLHDQYRKDHGGKDSYKNAVAAIRCLQAHGVQPDLLCTVNSSTAREPLAVYRALRELDTGWIQFIPVVRRDSEGRLTQDSVSANGYGDFLCAIFDEWALNDIGRLDVQLFAEAARVWAGGAAGLCWMAPSCGRALIVEMDGSVYSCDHYVYPEYRIGDIETSHLSNLVELPFQVRFGNNKRELLPHQCRACPWLSVCNGGCPKDRFVTDEEGAAAEPKGIEPKPLEPKVGGEPPLNQLCAGLKRFFAHAHPIFMHIRQLVRGGLDPAAIMAQLRQKR